LIESISTTMLAIIVNVSTVLMTKSPDLAFHHDVD